MKDPDGPDGGAGRPLRAGRTAYLFHAVSWRSAASAIAICGAPSMTCCRRDYAVDNTTLTMTAKGQTRSIKQIYDESGSAPTVILVRHWHREGIRRAVGSLLCSICQAREYCSDDQRHSKGQDNMCNHGRPATSQGSACQPSRKVNISVQKRANAACICITQSEKEPTGRGDCCRLSYSGKNDRDRPQFQ